MYEHLAGMTRGELEEALKDPNWRIRNLYYILDKEKKVVLFVPNEAQEKLLRRMWWKNIVPKARQRGFSTLIQLLILDACLFNENQRGAIVAHDQGTAQMIMRAKIEFAYERLPEFIRAKARIVTDNVKEKVLSNGSSIQVSTNARGDTLNWLHVSEFGIICAESPRRAEKVTTGALPAAAQGIVFIESTAKGREGAYYQMVKAALDTARERTKLNRLQYRLHFASWWDADEYELDPRGVIISPKDKKYFDELETMIGRQIPARKRAWYVETRRNDYADDDQSMWQEYPSTVEEAFQVSADGLLLGRQMATMRDQNRITRVPYDPTIPVNTFWDLGVGDDIAIWFHQSVGLMDHWINYYEISSVAYGHVVRHMQSFGYVFGYHFLPHDGDHRRPGAEALKTPRDMLEELGLRNIEIVPRTPDLMAAGLPALRADMANYLIDRENCAKGIEHLDAYKKAWNSAQGAWSEQPAKNGHQHAVDALRQKAQARDEVARLCGTARALGGGRRRRNRASSRTV